MIACRLTARIGLSIVINAISSEDVKKKPFNMLVCIGQFIQVSINIAKYTVRKLTFKRILAVINQFIHAILVLVL